VEPLDAADDHARRRPAPAAVAAADPPQRIMSAIKRDKLGAIQRHLRLY
jgi:hypothetical protein